MGQGLVLQSPGLALTSIFVRRIQLPIALYIWRTLNASEIPKTAPITLFKIFCPTEFSLG